MSSVHIDLLARLRTPTGQFSQSAKAKTAVKKLIEWLKDTSRQHDPTEDEKVIRDLTSFSINTWKMLEQEGIALLPPQPYSPVTHYHTDVLQYLEAYKKNPRRPPTDEESIAMLSHELLHTSYPSIVFPALHEAGISAQIPASYKLNGVSYQTHINRCLNNVG